MLFFFFNDTATTEIYTLSLHDALPISRSRDARDTGRRASLRILERLGCRRREGVRLPGRVVQSDRRARGGAGRAPRRRRDRKSTRLNSSHSQISYAVFCLTKTKLQFAI